MVAVLRPYSTRHMGTAAPLATGIHKPGVSKRTRNCRPAPVSSHRAILIIPARGPPAYNELPAPRLNDQTNGGALSHSIQSSTEDPARPQKALRVDLGRAHVARGAAMPLIFTAMPFHS